MKRADSVSKVRRRPVLPCRHPARAHDVFPRTAPFFSKPARRALGVYQRFLSVGALLIALAVILHQQNEVGFNLSLNLAASVIVCVCVCVCHTYLGWPLRHPSINSDLRAASKPSPRTFTLHSAISWAAARAPSARRDFTSSKLPATGSYS
jgi:hypothetical protein